MKYMSYSEYPSQKGKTMLKTMALKITKDTYPIAAALMPPGFLNIRIEDLIGCYVVINDWHIDDNNPGTSDQKRMMVHNCWITGESFKSDYTKAGPGREPEGSFFEVRRITP